MDILIFESSCRKQPNFKPQHGDMPHWLKDTAKGKRCLELLVYVFITVKCLKSKDLYVCVFRVHNCSTDIVEI
jgi:hypothetical protein